jgi:hypothetical protein
MEQRHHGVSEYAKHGTCLEAGSTEMAHTSHDTMEWLRKYYSDILEREITMHHTLLLVNVQLAFILAALPADYPLWARLACCTWLLRALKQVKNEEGEKEGSMEKEA